MGRGGGEVAYGVQRGLVDRLHREEVLLGARVAEEDLEEEQLVLGRQLREESHQLAQQLEDRLHGSVLVDAGGAEEVRGSGQERLHRQEGLHVQQQVRQVHRMRLHQTAQLLLQAPVLIPGQAQIPRALGHAHELSLGLGLVLGLDSAEVGEGEDEGGGVGELGGLLEVELLQAAHDREEDGVDGRVVVLQVPQQAREDIHDEVLGHELAEVLEVVEAQGGEQVLLHVHLLLVLLVLLPRLLQRLLGVDALGMEDLLGGLQRLEGLLEEQDQQLQVLLREEAGLPGGQQLV